MVRSGERFGWLGTVFFGLCLSVSLICLLPKASFLRMTPEVFFGVGRVFTRMVMFNYVESYPRSHKLQSLNTALTGFEAAIPDSYGLAHEDLADLLNRYKAESHRI